MTGNRVEPSPSSPSLEPAPNRLSWVLSFTALASVMTGFVQHGLFFLAKHKLGYTDQFNLWLAVAIFLPYAPGAMLAGPLGSRIGERRLLILLLVVMGACLIALGLSPTSVVLWAVAPIYNAASGMQWPIVESYVASGRHGRAMRRVIGWFNIVWAATVAFGVYIVTFMTAEPGESAGAWFFALAGMHLVMIGAVLRFTPRPAPHDAEVSVTHVGPEYARLLTSARVLLPLSYLLMDSFAPLMPGVWQRAGVDPPYDSSLTSTWMVARFLVFFVMFMQPGWHGRWGVLLGGGAGMMIGFALALIGPNPAVILLGLAIYGVGQGMVYYAALYYAMAIGNAGVESGGRHEAFIGLGYLGGPIVALLGRAAVPAHPYVGTIGAIAFCMIIGSTFALRPYLEARRQRGAS